MNGHLEDPTGRPSLPVQPVHQSFVHPGNALALALLQEPGQQEGGREGGGERDGFLDGSIRMMYACIDI